MIYLYLFGTCFHFIYVFMIIVKYFEKGLHSTAFSKMKNLFARTKNHKVLNNSMPYSTPCCRKFIV